MAKSDIKLDKQFVFSTKKVNEIKNKQLEGFSIPRYMNPWFKNQIGVRRAKLAFGWTQHELNEFAKCSASITYFANNYCKIKSEDGQVRQMTLRDYQYEVVNSYHKNRFTINMSSRQTGKCFTLFNSLVIKHKGVEKRLPLFKLLFKFKEKNTIYDYIKYPIYWILWKLN